jgi:hypothetical protein
VAAFCACCGAEITLKAEACPVCGTPQHGMSQPDLLLTLDVGTDPSQPPVLGTFGDLFFRWWGGWIYLYHSGA